MPRIRYPAWLFVAILLTTPLGCGDDDDDGGGGGAGGGAGGGNGAGGGAGGGNGAGGGGGTDDGGMGGGMGGGAGDPCDLCAETATCDTSGGGAACVCPSGFEGDGTAAGSGCTDIDECATAQNDCNVDVCGNTSGGFTCTALLGVSPFQNALVRLDPSTGAAVSRVPLADTLGTVVGANGLAVHPSTGTIFGIVRLEGVTGRVLFTMDPATRALTEVGNLGDNFASLAFSPDGTLHGVTGDGATTPETLYTIDTGTATPTLVRALGNGADGEAIAFHADGRLFHWSGNSTIVMESLDPADGFTAITDIPPTGALNGEIFGAVFDPRAGDFLVSNIASQLQRVTAEGAFTTIGANAVDDLRGLALSSGVARHVIQPAMGGAAGGNTVTIRGWGVSAATTVMFAGNAATDLTVVDDDTITVTAPAGGGTVAVEVANADGTMRALYSYTYVP